MRFHTSRPLLGRKYFLQVVAKINQQDIELTKKLNKKKIFHEKSRYYGFEFKGKTKIYRYKYMFEKIKPADIDEIENIE